MIAKENILAVSKHMIFTAQAIVQFLELPQSRSGIMRYLLFCLLFLSCSSIGEAQHDDYSLLVLVEVDDRFDYDKAQPLLTVMTHYFEPTEEARNPRHLLVGLTSREDLPKLERLSASLTVLTSQVEGFRFYWTQSVDPFYSAFGEGICQILHVTEDGGGMTSLPVDVRISSELVRTDFYHLDPEGVPLNRIRPRTEEELRREHQDMLPLKVEWKLPAQDLIDGITDGGCAFTMRQLLGLESVSVYGNTTEITSRRTCDSPEWAMIADWLADELQSYGWSVQIQQVVRPSYLLTCLQEDTWPQVVATLPGTDLAQQVYVAGAHIDSTHLNPSGADDNASGVAALLCAAKQLGQAKFRRTIQFVFFQAEEEGRIGSDHYVDWLLNSSGYDFCAMFNMDMIAYDKDQDRKMQIQHHAGGGFSQFIAKKVAEVPPVYGIDVTPVVVCDGDSSSDHGSFWQQGQAAVLVGEEYFCEVPLNPCNWQHYCIQEDFNPHSHTANDVISHLDTTLVRDTARVLVGFMAYAAGIQ